MHTPAGRLGVVALLDVYVDAQSDFVVLCMFSGQPDFHLTTSLQLNHHFKPNLDYTHTDSEFVLKTTEAVVCVLLFLLLLHQNRPVTTVE